MNRLKTLKIKRHLGIWGVVLLPIFLVGCFESSSSEQISDSGIYFPIDSVDYSAVTLDPAATNLPAGARLLASQCAQCHGTYGVAVANWPDLYGSGAVGTAMTDYQDLSYVDNMMHLHALAYTEAEVDLLKSYYSKVNYTPAGGQ
ncbi:hypothetical protein THMIRHAM_19780 [Thiomicrorhabdus immobilis]|uniref:Cytochrome c domain-containing protein n=1 Tax=Thiomicrorhabdus immobilis TaxID=2791037 RepID=A0ABN6CYM2_9GAMM|nr:hypothetical protein [Thiomicrorhabdus immobilis]BCN94193.1 hypothetical protein THMIRHAM_19780 [Thiomicrorhabdus immobilis]